MMDTVTSRKRERERERERGREGELNFEIRVVKKCFQFQI